MIEQLETSFPFNLETIEDVNLCHRFSEEDLKKISRWTWDGFSKDKQSRRKWEERTNAAMDLAMQIQEAKNFPWPNCSNIIFPLVSIAALQFSTRSYANLIRGTQLYRYKRYGAVSTPTQNSTQIAKILGRHLSWQVLEEDEAWEEQHDRLFITTSIVGCSFIKTMFSPSRKHNTSRLIQARNLVLHYNAASVEDCQRKTEVIELTRNEILSGIRRDIYRDVQDKSWFQDNARAGIVEQLSQIEHDNRVGLEAPQSDRDSPYTVLEQHCWMDCDGDGYAEPYVVTLETASRDVIRITARVDREEDVDHNSRGEIVSIRANEYYTKYGFIPAPDGGIYDMGFGVLLGPLNETVNSGINQIFDTGTSNMLGGGFAASGAKMKSGVYTRTPGEYKVIKGSSDDIRKALIPFPEIPVSEVVFKVISLVIQYADRLAGTVEAVVGENPGQNTPAQTYQGMVEQGMQIYKSIFKRMWRAMKEEGKKLHRLNAHFLPDAQRFGEGNERVTREMYKTSPDLLVPVADPDLVSEQQRIQRAGLVRQGAHSSPGYNLEEVERQWLEALNQDNIESVYPGAYSDWYQKHPLPNPKVQTEQMKVQGIQMKLKFEQWKHATSLMADQKKITAEIELIRAQAAKFVADIGADRAAHQLEVFDTIMEHLRGVSDLMNDRISTLLGAAGGETGENNQGGAGGAQEQPSGQGALGPPAQTGGQP